MFGSSGRLRRLQRILDTATFNFSVLSADSLTPQVVASLECQVRDGARYAAAKAGPAPVIEALEATRGKANAGGLAYWNAIVDRTIADLTAGGQQ